MVLKNKGEKYRLSCQGYPNCKEVVRLPSAIVKAEEVGGDRCRRCNALQLQFSFGMPIELGEYLGTTCSPMNRFSGAGN